ncbi:MAG: TolC family protein [Candidatus Abyssobacteria bacterium SURF_5]|uniref:TolC family protein n=1 Tax=Abyssobacteria bacterium (strain SURF_5) TaxID=2093360 RepID=A0A3A4N555_ABYX5|nr:MAG: TolC family protein [Candidatus Abyssubacteria bacterium SURF_5]
MNISKRKKFTLLSAGVILAVILASCAGIPTRNERAARQDLGATETVYRPAAAKPDLPVLTENSALAELLQYALLNSPRVESSFYEWKAAVEEITMARSLPNPMLQFDLEFVSGVVEALTPMLMTDPMSNWQIPSKLGLKAEAAYGEALGQRAAFENELLATALSVKRAYYQLWVVDRQIYWTREMLKIVEDIERIARERLAVGNVTQQDVLRAQIERDKLENELANLIDSRGPIVTRLKSALGIGPDQSFPEPVAALEPSVSGLTEESLLETAFERNPRLKEMRAQVLQAIALYQLSRKTTVPDYSFGFGANVEASPVPFMPSFGLTLPIWRDKIRAEISQGQAGVGAARARLSAEELELAVRFAETAFSWRETDRNVRLYSDRLIPKAKASLESARAGYTSGITDFLDLLDAEKTLLDYRLAHASAEGRREIVLAEMSLVILGRWPEGVLNMLGPDIVNDSTAARQVKKGKNK